MISSLVLPFCVVVSPLIFDRGAQTWSDTFLNPSCSWCSIPFMLMFCRSRVSFMVPTYTTIRSFVRVVFVTFFETSAISHTVWFYLSSDTFNGVRSPCPLWCGNWHGVPGVRGACIEVPNVASFHASMSAVPIPNSLA